MNTIAHHIISVKKRILALEQTYGRAKGSVCLLPVSKGHDAPACLQAIEAGALALAENVAQDALVKIEALKRWGVEWHFIGQIQSNKTRAIAEHFSWVHSLDREKLAMRFSEQRPAELPPLNICLQFNVSKESQKAGLDTKGVLSLAKIVHGLPNVVLRGLMVLPAKASNQREVFHEGYLLYAKLKEQYTSVDTLSMGMSQDIEAAIAEGSTMVRVGTGIFGARVMKL
jgi:PLP dependent protein